MTICSKCKAPRENGVCSLCGKSRYLKEASENDVIYLTSAEYIWSRMVEGALDDAGIKFLRRSSLGLAVTVSIGDFAEHFRYYVLLSDYDAAKKALPTEEQEFSDDELNKYIDSYTDL